MTPRSRRDERATFLLVVVLPILAVTAVALVQAGHALPALLAAVGASALIYVVFRRWGWWP